MALRPDGQALLIAVDGTVSGMPLERSLSGGHLSGAALHDLTHVGEVDVLAGHTGSFQRLFDRDRRGRCR